MDDSSAVAPDSHRPLFPDQTARYHIGDKQGERQNGSQGVGVELGGSAADATARNIRSVHAGQRDRGATPAILIGSVVGSAVEGWIGYIAGAP